MGVSSDIPDKAAVTDVTIDPIGLGLEELGAPRHIEAELARDANGEHTITLDTSDGTRWRISVAATVGRSLAPRLVYQDGRRVRVETLPEWVGHVLDHLEDELEAR